MYGLRKIWNPGMFQGVKRGTGYFEGWYFKCLNRDETVSLVLIPGVSYEAGDPHAFLQVFMGREERYLYHRFERSEFSFSRREFMVEIGESSFSQNGCSVKLDRPEQHIDGALRFGPLSPWPVRLFSPGAMGPYAFVPGMEDYHGVISFHHEISGTLRIDGKDYDFDGGSGYIEKDWGVSFPSRWIWIHSNHFTGGPASLSLSVATIPWRGRSFTGYIVGFWLDGTLYRFCTYTGAVIEDFTLDEQNAGIGDPPGVNRVKLLFSGGGYTLLVRGIKTGGTKLVAPSAGTMTGHVHESLTSTVDVELVEAKSGKTIFSGAGSSAGIELHGDLAGLLQAALVRK